MHNNRIACSHCDLLLNKNTLEAGQTANCPRCHHTLYYDTQDFKLSIGLLFAALFIYFPAIFLPFLKMEISGFEHEVSLWESVVIIAHDKTIFLSVIVFILIILLPLVRIVGLLFVTGAIQLSLSSVNKSFIRSIVKISPWNMVEIYMVGVIVTLVKLVSLADIHISEGFFAFCVLIVLNALISIVLPTQRIWETAYSNNKLA